MDAKEAVRRHTARFLEVLRIEVAQGRTLATTQADEGDLLLQIRRDLRKAGMSWEDWLVDQRAQARERGLPGIGPGTARARIRMAQFRRRHPGLASELLGLDPSCLGPILNLPTKVLQEFRRDGVPSRTGERVPILNATSRQMKWAARLSRATLAGRPAPKTERRAPTASPPAPEVASSTASPGAFEQALQLLRQTGRLSLEQVGQVVDILLEKAALPADAPETRTTRRLMMGAFTATGEERRALAGRAASELEHAAALFQAAGPDPAAARRVRNALVRFLGALARAQRDSA